MNSKYFGILARIFILMVISFDIYIILSKPDIISMLGIALLYTFCFFLGTSITDFFNPNTKLLLKIFFKLKKVKPFLIIENEYCSILDFKGKNIYAIKFIKESDNRLLLLVNDLRNEIDEDKVIKFTVMPDILKVYYFSLSNILFSIISRKIFKSLKGYKVMERQEAVNYLKLAMKVDKRKRIIQQI